MEPWGPTHKPPPRRLRTFYIFFGATRRVQPTMVRFSPIFLSVVVVALGQQCYVESFVHSQAGRTSILSSSVIGRSMTSTTLLEPIVAPVKEETIPATTRSSILSRSTHGDHPTLGEVRKLLPSDVFQVDTATSLMYFAVDFLAVVATMTCLDLVVTSQIYHSMPMWAQALSVAPLQVLTGFTMWCMWCIGHDAGHTTISKNRSYGKIINRVVGELAHSMMCLTPFVPWKSSHLKHHIGHNHLTNDYSHQWFIREQRDELPSWIAWGHATRNFQLPFLYLVYLLFGVPDGGHVFFYGRMWEGESMKKKLNAAVSVAISMATAGTLWATMGTADFAVVCVGPWLVMSFWLFMVTYLQHHSGEDGRLYTDHSWTFERGAFETVDRNYGTWINRMSHHMMDGHVVHHLFFSRVPHYHLEKATKALVKGMEERGQGHLYKMVETPDFTQEIVRQFDKDWFFINEQQIVRD